MTDAKAAGFAWTPSATLPRKRVSFAGVSHHEMVERARRLKPALAERAEACERLRRMPEQTEGDLHAAGLFRIVQPARVGGAELDVGIFVDVCAEVAQVCPSTAWNIGNLASHHWMLGYFRPQAQDEIWSQSADVLIATSLVFPAGRARKVDGGYVISGRWPLSSGVENSDWNMLGVTVRDSDEGPAVDTRLALVHRSQYEILDTWYAVGLSGTGSTHVTTKDLFVPEYRTLAVRELANPNHPGSSVNTTPLFRLPMMALGPYVLSGVMLGCAIGAYEATVGPARRRLGTVTGTPISANPTMQLKVAEASARIDAARLIMRSACSHAMEVARAGHEAKLDDKVRYRRDAFFSVRMCLEAVDILMTVAGSSGLLTSGSLQRLFRDAHAANAHQMFSPDIQALIFGQQELGAVATPPLL